MNDREGIIYRGKEPDMKKVILIILSVLMLGSTLPEMGSAQATILTFDDISTLWETYIPDGYGGLNWDYFSILNAPEMAPDSGYYNGLVSGNYVAHNDGLNLATINGDEFTFNGAYLTGAWHDELNVQVEGYLDEELIYSTTVVVDTIEANWFWFNYTDIDELRFTSFGGTTHPGYIDGGEQFAMDNFTFNEPIPEPTSLGLLAFGGICLMMKRSKKACTFQ